MSRTRARLLHEIDAQAVTSVERGYNIYEANCARCHGVNGQGFANEAGAPPLNEQDKLFAHLNPTYLQSVLREGGRYVCGNAKSLMPVWSNENGGPLNYQQIDDLIAFLRATNDHTYTSATRHERAGQGRDGQDRDVHRLGRPELQAGPERDALPGLLDERLRERRRQPDPGCLGPGGTTVVDVKAQNVAFTTTEISAPADKTFQIKFDNEDASVQHNVEIKDASGKSLFKGDLVTGVNTATYTVPALAAGSYPFNCTVHPNMTGTLTVK